MGSFHLFFCPLGSTSFDGVHAHLPGKPIYVSKTTCGLECTLGRRSFQIFGVVFGCLEARGAS